MGEAGATTGAGASRQVAFLRGLNVGGHRVKMPALKAVFEAVGLTEVATYIASGNVIYTPDGRTAAELETALEAALQDALGYPVSTFIRGLDEVATLAAPGWLDAAKSEGFNVHCMFLKQEPDDAVRAGLDALQSPDDEFRNAGRQLYWLRRGGLSESPIKAHHLDKAVQRWPNTIRTLNTVARIAKKFGLVGWPRVHDRNRR